MSHNFQAVKLYWELKYMHNLSLFPMFTGREKRAEKACQVKLKIK